MRRSIALLGILSLTLLGLTSCGDDDGGGSGKGLESVKITDTPGSAPKVTWDGELDLDKSESDVLVKGDGAKVTGDQKVLVHIWIGNGFSQDQAFSTWDLKKPEILSAKATGSPALKKAIEGQTIGSRVAVAASSKDAFDNQGNAGLNIGNRDSVLFVVDILTDVLDKPEGAEKKAPASAPVPVIKDDAVTKFGFAKAAKPGTKLQVIPLIEGTGPAVKKGNTVAINYFGEVFGAKEPFDQTYDKGAPAAFRLVQSSSKEPQGLIKGWVDGLEGVKVGSRVMLIIPPADGYGAKGNPQAKIKGTDTLVFVIDVLGVTS